uniref:TSA: Wollemia nobilis Ref_Wollemi_Transcript_5463_1093 transcribed RNA sequence n=1 Tax=Wollemia nobilis TaxID=56998 RepID=A0A0C9RPH1_9CONI
MHILYNSSINITMLKSISFEFSLPRRTCPLPSPSSIQLNSHQNLKVGDNSHKGGKFCAPKKRIGLKGAPARLEPLQAAGEGLPTELIEDPKFVPLSEDDPRFGPPALLLMGFKYEEISKIQALLKEMDGEFLKIILCTPDMIKLSLWDAMHVEQPDLEKLEVADGLPRICFLSGLNGEETMMFIDAFPEAGLDSAVFAALVPNSAGKSVKELIEEIMGDHERLA